MTGYLFSPFDFCTCRPCQRFEHVLHEISSLRLTHRDIAIRRLLDIASQATTHARHALHADHLQTNLPHQGQQRKRPLEPLSDADKIQTAMLQQRQHRPFEPHANADIEVAMMDTAQAMDAMHLMDTPVPELPEEFDWTPPTTTPEKKSNHERSQMKEFLAALRWRAMELGILRASPSVTPERVASWGAQLAVVPNEGVVNVGTG